MAPPRRHSTCCGRDSMISRVSWCTPTSHCQWKARTVRSATARDTLVDRDGPVYIEKQLVDSRHQCRSSLGVERCRIGDFGRASRPHRSLRWAPERRLVPSEYCSQQPRELAPGGQCGGLCHSQGGHFQHAATLLEPGLLHCRGQQLRWPQVHPALVPADRLGAAARGALALACRRPCSPPILAATMRLGLRFRRGPQWSGMASCQPHARGRANNRARRHRAVVLARRRAVALRTRVAVEPGEAHGDRPLRARDWLLLGSVALVASASPAAPCTALLL